MKRRQKHKLILKHRWALGDTVLMTALVRDIHRAYPNTYDIQVETNWTPIWWNNPYVCKFPSTTIPRPSQVEVSWRDGILWNGRARYGKKRELKHILAWYHYDFERKTGIHVPVTDPRPELWLTQEEKRRIIQGRYWVIVSGGKMDITNKHWHAERYQEVVNRLKGYGLSFVQCGATHDKHYHPPMDNVLNMVGQTDNVRDFFNIVMHSEGVICPVTGAMHIAAAFDKPCVVLSGGREEPWFEWYGNGFGTFGEKAKPVKVPHKFLHTLGQLYCCDVQGCWKKRTVPVEPSDLQKGKKNLCKEPVRGPNQSVAKCMDMITVDHVVEAIMEHYEEGILPPIAAPKGKYPAVDVPAAPVATPAPEQTQKPSTIMVPPAAAAPPPTIRIPTVELQTEPPVTKSDKPTDLGGGEVKVVREPRITKVQRPHQQAPPKEYSSVRPNPSRAVDYPVLDNPVIGGKFTVCVLCYGDHADLAKKCLDSILTSLPANRVDLRVATNSACEETVRYVEQLPCTKTYIHGDNRMKYPVMRDMFWDETHPIRTNYVLWFDDDTTVVDPRWPKYLGDTIVSNHRQGVRMYGIKMFHDLNIYAKKGHRPERWFTDAPWYNGAHFRVRGGERRAPNGSLLDFCVGWFWALGTDAIRAGDIPDRRLNHNGGDITIGEQVHQAGFKMKMFNKGKVFVFTPTKEQGGRRGFEEKFPWAKPELVAV